MNQDTNTSSPAPVLYCANHPNRETLLRCNRCEKPICNQCAVLTPTGYRCKECVRGQQKVFDTAQWVDYPLAFAVAAAVAFAGSFVVPFLSFFTIFIAPLVGFAASEGVRLVVRKRRSRQLFLTAAAGSLLGGSLLALPALLTFILLLSGGSLGGVWGLLWRAVYVFLVTSTTYYRLSGIQLR